MKTMRRNLTNPNIHKIKMICQMTLSRRGLYYLPRTPTEKAMENMIV
jgi:ribosomal protein L19